MNRNARLMLAVGCVVGLGAAPIDTQSPDPESWTGQMQTNHGPAPLAITLEHGNDGINGSVRLAFGSGPAPERPMDDLVVDGDRWSFTAMVETNVGPAFVEFDGTRSGDRVEGSFTTYLDGQAFADGTWFVVRKETGAGGHGG